MKKKEINEIMAHVVALSDEKLEEEYYTAVDNCLGSQVDTMIERGYDSVDIIEREKHEKYLEMLKSDPQDWEGTMYRRNYYGNEQIDYRINKLMENELWKKIVPNKPRYIKGEGTAKYMELHVIKAPKPIINDLNNIYKEVCWLQGLEDGKW